MKKLLFVSFCSLFMYTTLQGMFKKLNIPFFYARSTLKNYTSTNNSKLNDEIPTLPEDLQKLRNLFRKDIDEISRQITKLEESIVTQKDLIDIIKKEDTDE